MFSGLVRYWFCIYCMKSFNFNCLHRQAPTQFRPDAMLSSHSIGSSDSKAKTKKENGHILTISYSVGKRVFNHILVMLPRAV